MNQIKNIIFDLGGVILNIDYFIVVDAFKQLGISNFDEWYSQKSQNDLFDRLETGKVSPQVFRDEIKKRIGKNVSDAEIDTAWNAILLDLPAERVKLIQNLKGKYRCFLLSNTNDIHIESFSASIEKVYGSIDIFNNLFEKIYYSSKIGLRKPHVEVFEFVLKENELLPQETLFIDDSVQHIEGAKKAGINTVFLSPGKTILELFDKDYALIS